MSSWRFCLRENQPIYVSETETTPWPGRNQNFAVFANTGGHEMKLTQRWTNLLRTLVLIWTKSSVKFNSLRVPFCNITSTNQEFQRLRFPPLSPWFNILFHGVWTSFSGRLAVSSVSVRCLVPRCRSARLPTNSKRCEAWWTSDSLRSAHRRSVVQER